MSRRRGYLWKRGRGLKHRSGSFSCRLCAGGLKADLSERDAKTGLPLRVVICLGCGLVQQETLPPAGDLRDYYSHHYRGDYKGTFTPKPKHVFRAALAARERIDFLENSLATAGQPYQSMRMLDIGAGGGEFVCVASRRGHHSCGIEPNLGYSEFARQAYGVVIETKHLDDLKDDSFELVTMFHVLEHMPDPSAVMAALFQVIKEGGFLMIEVPNIEQKDASPSNIYFKAHLYYFSRLTLLSFASPYFDPIKVEEEGNLRVLFRRRQLMSGRRLPTADEVASTLSNIARKGWLQYLTVGGGWRKPYWRMRRMIEENSVVRLSPEQIIQKVLIKQA